MDKLVETNKERFWNAEAWARDQWVKAQAAKIPAKSRVLDAGAGASKYRPFFAHCHYETQDFCQYKGELVKYVQPIDYVCDITNIPLPPASLDLILCTEVLEHVINPMAVISEFARLLKPGGRLLLTAPLLAHLHMEPYHFYGGFTSYWYLHWLRKYGFSVESCVPQGGPGRCVAAFLNAYYMSWRTWEHTLTGPKRILSLAFRMLLKIPVHYIVPCTLPKLDLKLNRNQLCIGFMVSAVRVNDQQTRSSENP